MPIADYQSVMRPLLAFGSDGSEKNINDAINSIANQLALTDDERHQLLPSGKQAIFANRVHWARTFLDKAGAIKRTRRSHFVITDRGKQLLTDHPTRIDVKVLKKFPEFVAFQSPKIISQTENASSTTPIVNEVEESTVTPEEAIQQAETQIFANLGSQLLVRIGELSPSFFERLVVDLVVAMGYDGSRASVVQKLGKSGDEGIDGVVNEDPLAWLLRARWYSRRQLAASGSRKSGGVISWFAFIVFRRDIVVGSLFGGHQFLGKAAPKITLRCFHQPGHQIFRHSVDRSILIDFGVD